MKRPKLQKKSVLLLVMKVLLSTAAIAAEPNPHEAELLEAIHQMRVKQQEEEGSVVRVIQQPIALQTQFVCSSVTQARDRIQQLGHKKEKAIGNVTVEAGHGEVSIDGNSGTINNSVNVQVVNPNERFCP